MKRELEMVRFFEIKDRCTRPQILEARKHAVENARFLIECHMVPGWRVLQFGEVACCDKTAGASKPGISELRHGSLQTPVRQAHVLRQW